MNDQEFLVSHYAKQVAELRDENQRLLSERDLAITVLDRMLKWLRGKDKEFSKLIAEFVQSRKG